jgi:hypothetical protein
MRLWRIVVIGLVSAVFCTTPTLAKKKVLHCPAFDVKGDRPLSEVTIPPTDKCKVYLKAGFGFPDPTCTPGAVNPHLTDAILHDPEFVTGCERDKASSAVKKKQTYAWYGIKKPANNAEPHMICELDHLISIQLGGADTLDNIWPQCGPKGAKGKNRLFKRKDEVENWLAQMIRDGTMTKKEAQHGIAEDWTQYAAQAKAYYANHKEPKDGG